MAVAWRSSRSGPGVGGAAGAGLLLWGSSATFKQVVPWLIALGSVLLLVRDPLRGWLARRRMVESVAEATRTPSWRRLVPGGPGRDLRRLFRRGRRDHHARAAVAGDIRAAARHQRRQEPDDDGGERRRGRDLRLRQPGRLAGRRWRWRSACSLAAGAGRRPSASCPTARCGRDSGSLGVRARRSRLRGWRWVGGCSVQSSDQRPRAYGSVNSAACL